MRNKLPFVILIIWITMDIFSRIDGSISFVEKFVNKEKEVNKIMEIIRQIFDIGTPLIILWLIWLLRKVIIQNDNYKSKLMALKKFRDNEMIAVINHYNTQFEDIEKRMESLRDKTNAYKKEAEPSLNEKLLIEENFRQKQNELIEYNKAFEDWGIGNYGKENKTTIIKEYFFKK